MTTANIPKAEEALNAKTETSPTSSPEGSDTQTEKAGSKSPPSTNNAQAEILSSDRPTTEDGLYGFGLDASNDVTSANDHGKRSSNVNCLSPKAITDDKSAAKIAANIQGVPKDEGMADNDTKTTFFWKSLTFWQRISDSNSNTINTQNITGSRDARTAQSPTMNSRFNEISQLQVNVESSSVSVRSHRSTRSRTIIDGEDTSLLTTNLLSPLQPVTNITETTIETVNAESRPQSSNDETQPKPNIEHDEPTSIWDITRRVSYIPFMSKLDENTTATAAAASVDTFTPNTISKVIGNTLVASPLADTNENVPEQNAEDGDVKEKETINNWWNPTGWVFGGRNNDAIGSAMIENGGVNTSGRVSDMSSAAFSETGIVEDELLRVQRKEMINQIKVQSYGIPKAKCWAIMRKQADDKYGELVITGNGYKKPVIAKMMPESVFETTENGIAKKANPNLSNLSMNESIVLPDIQWNYRDYTWRTQWRIACSRIPKVGKVFIPQSHLYYDDSVRRKNKSNKRMKKSAVIICFHGFLPQKIVRNVIGESTGTAEEMSQIAVREMRRWSDINNVDMSITTINIEGHGKLFERVNGCLSILESWNDAIKNCDYLLSVANSHNVLLAIHTLARLVTSGVLEDVEKLGLIGLSGICMGPVPEIESKISARGSVGQDNEMISEIFDLEDPESLQSKEMLRNMRTMMKMNFKVTFVGSLNDCFAPLYSTLSLHLRHPNIFRAIYIDGAENQADFLVSLFNLILTVKNLNYSDHGLLIELSSFFNGKTGNGGHSKILRNKYAYRNGISNMLNTSDLVYPQSLQEDLLNFQEHTTNSYHIPWCLRGFLEEMEKLQRHFDIDQMIEQLYEEFKSWEPIETKERELWYCMQAFENVLNEDLGF